MRKTATGTGECRDRLSSFLRTCNSGSSRIERMHVPDAAEANMIVNAMSVDVEDYFHVSAFATVIDCASWSTYTNLMKD